MKEVIFVLKRNLFCEFLSHSREDLELVCRKASNFLSCQDSILLHWKDIDSLFVGNDYFHLMMIIHYLDSKEDSDFHLLEWFEETNHMDEMGCFYDNPWRTSLQTKMTPVDLEKKIELTSFF